MKCQECGYNFFVSLNVCPKCTAPTSAINNFSSDNSPQHFSLFEEDEPLLLDEEIVEGYSFHGTAINRSISSNKGVSTKSLPVLASIGRRFIAFFIDISIVLAVSFLTLMIGLLASGIEINENVMSFTYVLLPVYLILCILASTLFLFLHSYSGKSFGKLLLGIRVVREDGRGISLVQSFARWIGYYLSAIPVLYGYLSALSDYNNRTWHDKISNTYVIRDN